MVAGSLDYCPSCGTGLDAYDPPSVYRCPSCEDFVFDNPAPNCRVAVVDGDSLLLVEIIDEYRLADPPYDAGSEWMLPGGHLELGEQPEEGAARELREETDLAVDPDDLELFDAVVRQVIDGAHGLILLYAVEREATAGTLSAGSDAGDARFWTPAELARADASFRELYDEPAAYRDPGGWLDRARAALDGARR